MRLDLESGNIKSGIVYLIVCDVLWVARAAFEGVDTVYLVTTVPTIVYQITHLGRGYITIQVTTF